MTDRGLEMLSNYQRYSTDDRRRLIAHMERSFPQLIPSFSPPIRSHGVEAIGQFAKSPPDDALREPLFQLNAAVSRALK